MPQYTSVEPRGAAPAAVDAPVSPRAGAGAPAPSQAPAAAPAGAGEAPALPEELVSLPPITAILAGEVPAVSADIQLFQKRPEGKLIAENAQVLQEAGVGFYGGLDGKTGVLFNQFHINSDEIRQADEAGKLMEVAPPFDEVAKSLPTDDNIAHKGLKSHPGQLAPPSRSPNQSASAQAQNIKVPGANTSPAKQQARTARQGLGDPSSGPKPGSGRLLNSILQPVV